MWILNQMLFSQGPMKAPFTRDCLLDPISKIVKGTKIKAACKGGVWWLLSQVVVINMVTFVVAKRSPTWSSRKVVFPIKGTFAMCIFNWVCLCWQVTLMVRIMFTYIQFYFPSERVCFIWIRSVNFYKRYCSLLTYTLFS